MALYVSQLPYIQQQAAVMMDLEDFPAYMQSFRTCAAEMFPRATAEALDYLSELWAWIGLYTHIPFNVQNPMYTDYTDACDSIRELMGQLEVEKVDHARDSTAKDEIIAAKDATIAANEGTIKTFEEAGEIGKGLASIGKIAELIIESTKLGSKISEGSQLALARTETAKAIAELIEARTTISMRDKEITDLKAELEFFRRDST